jgi:glyoxylase-like metal-dependent hydrolase (beta-lactamase superfamily II)
MRALILVILLPVTALVQSADLYDVQIQKITDHVYVALRPEPLREYVEGNVTIIVNDRDVVLVDAGGAPTSAARVVAAIKKITPLPVRYIIFTHIHRDHRFGAQAYLDAYPGAEVIGHPTVQRIIAESGDGFVVATIARLEKQRAGAATTIAQIEQDRPVGHERVIAYLRRYYENDLPRMLREYRNVRNIAPSLTVSDRLTLHRGDRDIDIRHIGKGDGGRSHRAFAAGSCSGDGRHGGLAGVLRILSAAA